MPPGPPSWTESCTSTPVMASSAGCPATCCWPSPWGAPSAIEKELSMSRTTWGLLPGLAPSLASVGLALLAVGAVAGDASVPAATPTFSKDVAPILNDRCVACHRAGEIGPMALTSYKEVRPYAKAIRDQVADGKMPPWHADPHYGKFANDRRLSEAEVRTVLQWINAGSPEGDPKDLPPPPKFTEGWQVGKPDVEIAIPKPYDVPASGEVEYQYVTVPTGFTEDKWVSAAEIRPGNREVVHHVIVFVLPPEGEPVTESTRDRERFGKLCPEARPDAETPKRLAAQRSAGRVGLGTHRVGWAPGLQGVLSPSGSAQLIRAGSRLMFQLHYTPNGKAAVDKDTRVGLIFAKEPITQVMHTVGIS